jgi:prepilin-type N-terminal cleavage/methylation domain-containing protein
MKHTFRHNLGLSLVELLIAMAILGILLAMLSAFLMSNQRVTTTQITAATLSNDVRLAHLRIGEIISQAHYIYPSGITLTINAKTFVTGKAGLAILVPRGTTYCKAEGASATTQDYCGFAYVIDDRSPYTSLLGLGNPSSEVIAEYKQEGLTWNPKDAVTNEKTPAELGVLTVWPNATANPVADSVDSAQTNLAGNLDPALRKGAFDDKAGFDLTTPTDNAKALISAVTSTIALKRTINGKPVSVSRDNYVFSKAIPRSALPNAPK